MTWTAANESDPKSFYVHNAGNGEKHLKSRSASLGSLGFSYDVPSQWYGSIVEVNYAGESRAKWVLVPQ